MSIEQQTVKAPTTYQEWLSCFDLMMSGAGSDEVYEAARRGSFVGSDSTNIALQKQITKTINIILEKSVKRFVKKLNAKIELQEHMQLESLFKRLNKDANHCLFFTRLTFLPKAFRLELEASVKKNINEFWHDTIKFLHEQSMETSNSELEDVLYLVKRISPFH